MIESFTLRQLLESMVIDREIARLDEKWKERK